MRNTITTTQILALLRRYLGAETSHFGPNYQMSYEESEAYDDETVLKLQRIGLGSLSRSAKVPCARTSVMIVFAL